MYPDHMQAPLSFVGWVIGMADCGEAGAVTWPDKSKWPSGTELIAFGGPVDDAEVNRFAYRIRVYGLCFGEQPCGVTKIVTEAIMKVARRIWPEK
jgi:hypothetical protein